MFLPMGFSVPKRFEATVGPITATRLRFAISFAVMNDPFSTLSDRICISSGVTPSTVVFQLRFPFTT